MYQKLKITAGIVILISFQGCGLTRLLDSEFRRDNRNFKRLGVEFEKGKPNYYTKEEQERQYDQFLKDMEKVREIAEKNKNN